MNKITAILPALAAFAGVKLDITITANVQEPEINGREIIPAWQGTFSSEH